MFILYVGCKSTKKAKVPNFKVSIWNSNYYFMRIVISLDDFSVLYNK